LATRCDVRYLAPQAKTGRDTAEGREPIRPWRHSQEAQSSTARGDSVQPECRYILAASKPWNRLPARCPMPLPGG